MGTFIAFVRILLSFAKYPVDKLLPFAKGIRDKILVDADIHITPEVQTELQTEVEALDGTVILRETDKSKTLTKTEKSQTRAVVLTLKKIARTTEEQANALFPGDATKIEIIIFRIGFFIIKAADAAVRTFEVFKTLVGKAFVRVKKNKLANLYHWRWSDDEITWHRLADTTVSSVVIFGLESKKTIYFQTAETLKVKGVPQLNAYLEEPIWGDTISALIP